MQLNLTKGVTEVSRDVYDLHMLAMYICVAIGVVVFGAMFWSMVFHRKSKGAKSADFHESTKVEILWTAIPIVILIAMAVPATKTLIEMENNDDSDVTIQVTASQWKWHYKYFDQDIEFYSVLSTPRSQYETQEGKHLNVDAGDKVKGENYLLEVDKHLVIPVNKKVRFLITSDDVIHAWWVPAFAVKQDANPGFINEAWTKVDKPGIYRGQCAELCGKDHGFMPIVVEVKSEADYAKWLDEQHQLNAQAAAAEKASLNASASMDELMTLGETTYIAHCAACHQVSGAGLPPAFPALKGSPVATGSIAAHIDIVLNGKAGTGMQAYGKQLSMKQIAAVVTYERNAWGNNTGDAVQAADVKGAAKGSGNDTETPVAVAEMVAEEAPVEDLTKVYSEDELMVMGEQVYMKACAACHQVSGAGLPPAFPALKGSAIALGDIAVHIDMVINGSKKNPAMAAFGSQLTKTEIAAVVTYERNAWGNNTGDLVQPAAVDAASAK
ncbi:cytochrome c oxidase subunit II [Colwellia sp. BRX10-1]|jgi:cytochrome c oxidase subunit 2|nr:MULTISPECIES: cytochrome c oxidase subunit II [unclassified Colwellia]MBA6336632.1 cytochrome c oxidase subunit II [Colwellia sp. BRX8-7]MBA6348550.1 cytochrome c oxidase subunit II [Colwellia sp. BRX8-9]MBA6378823.1 cytochrome c oxidase subunit II [Colwellia sp. BRX10-7]MBA6386960.1 cytochrome c oxidase subunit II [Colwellia sp. BRX10-2]MBA6401275.1 cytochrome c oxidase subunit II [Colwellia sp. BRX10-5]